jgi:hypothetical protein
MPRLSLLSQASGFRLSMSMWMTKHECRMVSWRNCGRMARHRGGLLDDNLALPSVFLRAAQGPARRATSKSPSIIGWGGRHRRVQVSSGWAGTLIGVKWFHPPDVE